MAGGYASDIGNTIGDYLLGEAQKKKDQSWLDYLSGKLQDAQGPALPADIPPPPPSRSPDLPPIQGPTMPPGQAPADPSLAPMQGLPGGAPYSSNYLDNGVNGLVQARKESAKSLFESPEQTLNLLLEAKRHEVGPGMNSLLDFIAGLHKEAATKQELSQRLEAMQKTAQMRAQTQQGIADARDALAERLGQDRNQTSTDVANIHAAATRYAADHHPAGHDVIQNIDGLSVDDLHNLQDGIEADMQQLQQPDKSHYDAYNPLDMGQFKQDYSNYEKTRNQYNTTLRRIKNAIIVKSKQPQPGATSPPAASPAAAPTPSPTPSPAPMAPPAAPSSAGLPASSWSDQQLAQALASNGKDSSPKSIALYRALLQHNGR